MENVLAEINAVKGVRGCFVCDEKGQLLASAMPDGYDEGKLAEASDVAAQMIASLWMAKKRRVGDVDLLFADGRLVVRGLERAYLMILCRPRLNLPLLNLTAEVAIKRLQKKISSAPPRPAPPSKRQRLRQVAEEMLGEHAPRVLAMLEAAGDGDEELAAAAAEAQRFVGFFLSQDKAEELGRALRAIIDE